MHFWQISWSITLNSSEGGFLILGPSCHAVPAESVESERWRARGGNGRQGEGEGEGKGVGEGEGEWKWEGVWEGENEGEGKDEGEGGIEGVVYTDLYVYVIFDQLFGDVLTLLTELGGYMAVGRPASVRRMRVCSSYRCTRQPISRNKPHRLA